MVFRLLANRWVYRWNALSSSSNTCSSWVDIRLRKDRGRCPNACRSDSRQSLVTLCKAPSRSDQSRHKQPQKTGSRGAAVIVPRLRVFHESRLSYGFCRIRQPTCNQHLLTNTLSVLVLPHANTIARENHIVYIV